MSSTVERGPAGLPQWLVVTLQLVLMGVLTPLLLATISPVAALKGDLLLKVLFLGRFVALIAAATVLLKLSGRGWADVGLRKPRPLRVLLAIPLGFGLVILMSFGARLAIAKLGLQAEDHSMFAPLRGNVPLYLFMMIPVTWGTAAFGEEMLFRGFFLDTLRSLFGPEGPIGTTLAIIAQAVLFGLMHFYQGAGGAVVTGAVALAFGLVWWATRRNLWAGIVLHGIIDSLSMTALYLGVTGAG